MSCGFGVLGPSSYECCICVSHLVEEYNYDIIMMRKTKDRSVN